MFDFRNIPPEDARAMYDGGIWDDATMTEWITVRSSDVSRRGAPAPEQIQATLGFMKAQRETS